MKRSDVRRTAWWMIAATICVASATERLAAQTDGPEGTPPPALRIDPEIEALVTRAEELERRKEFDLAATLWQKLLDESGHQLVKADAVRYEPLREMVFRRLAALPPEALREYRVTADGEARGLLAAAGDDDAAREVALAEVVRRYFLSSIGDDAAFELAGMALDRRDFVTTSRLTRAILQRHPDPDVPRAAVLLRQAAADAYLGDRKGTTAGFDQLGRLAPGERGESAIDAVRSYLTEQVLPRRGASAGRGSADESRVSTLVPRTYSAPPRDLARGPLTEHLVQSWTVPESRELPSSTGWGDMPVFGTFTVLPYASIRMFGGGPVASSTFAAPMMFEAAAPAIDVDVAESIAMDVVWDGPVVPGNVVGHRSGDDSPTGGHELTEEEKRGALVARWRQRGWQPTVQYVPVSDGFVFRSDEDLSAWRVEQGKLKQAWRTARRNRPLPEALLTAPWPGGTSGGVQTGAEFALFGDALALATVAHDGRVFTLEGPRKPLRDKPAGRSAGAGRAPPPATEYVEVEMTLVDDSGRVVPVRKTMARPGLPPAEKPSESDDEPERTPPKPPAADSPADGEPRPSEARPVAPSSESGPIPATPGAALATGEEEAPLAGDPGPSGPAAPNRQRVNYLAAYDLRTGELLWRRSASESAPVQRRDADPEPPAYDAGFVGPPAAWGDRLLVPVLSGGAFAIVALRSDDGAVLWRTPLGDEPDAGTSFRSAASVVIAGGDAYVALGTGLVYALDARSGALHWAAAYERHVQRPSAAPNPYGPAQTPTQAVFSGWDSDLTFVAGAQLVVLASDHDQLLALDRRTGATRWTSPRQLSSGGAARYALGIFDRRLFVAGTDVVRAYDLPSGRLEWERAIPSTSGRGCVTPEAIYLPILGSVDGAVLALDPATGRELGQSAVVLTSPEPLGNLVSDGRRLWSAGANRVYALTHVPAQLAALDAGAAERRTDDLVQRARLLARLGRRDEALADARRARDLLAPTAPRDAVEVVLDLLLTSRAAHERPLAALRLLAEPLPFDADDSRDARLAREQLVRAALGELYRRPAPEATTELLRSVAAWAAEGQTADRAAAERIVNAVARTLARHAAPSDLPALRAAFDAGPYAARRAVLPALAARGEAEDVARLETLLASDDESLRVAAALALAAGRGSRAALAKLAEATESSNLDVRRAALHALRRAAGSDVPAVPLDADEAGRRAGRQQWSARVAALEADRPPAVDAPARFHVLDRILLVQLDPGSCVELDGTGRELWRSDALPSPTACTGTDDGHRVVLIQGGRKIVEYDAQGALIWESGLLPYRASSLERLPDGSTLVACPQRDALLEVAPDGHVVRRRTVRGGPYSAQRLDDRRTLVALSGAGRVVEVGPDGKTIWEAAEWPNAAHAQRLADGRTLLSQTKFNWIGGLALLDRTGQRVEWRRDGLRSIGGAVRFADGSTVFAAESILWRLGADGQMLWSKPFSQVSGVAAN